MFHLLYYLFVSTNWWESILEHRDIRRLLCMHLNMSQNFPSWWLDSSLILCFLEVDVLVLFLNIWIGPNDFVIWNLLPCPWKESYWFINWVTDVNSSLLLLSEKTWPGMVQFSCCISVTNENVVGYLIKLVAVEFCSGTQMNSVFEIKLKLSNLII